MEASVERPQECGFFFIPSNLRWRAYLKSLLELLDDIEENSFCNTTRMREKMAAAN